MAPATKPTQNPTGYPGDLKFPGRCDCYLLQFKPRSDTWQFFNISFVTREEVPMLDSDLERKLERRLKTRQVEPMGDGGVVEGGVQINQHQDCDLKQICI